MGRVTPLFKKHDKSKKEYYRPVTVLPALNNIFKRLLSFQISKFYGSIFSDFISAYRRQHEVAAARHHWLDWLMIGGGVTLTARRLLLLYPWTCQRHLTPFRAHQLLIAKLRAYGIDERGCALLSNYLQTGRMQRIHVKVGDTFSDWMCYVRKGVPQGSFLGPMFFNLFISNLLIFISDIKIVRLNAYADDNQLYTSNTNIAIS